MIIFCFVDSFKVGLFVAKDSRLTVVRSQADAMGLVAGLFIVISRVLTSDSGRMAALGAGDFRSPCSHNRGDLDDTSTKFRPNSRYLWVIFMMLPF